ncbi:MAG: cytochrome c biogenesis protein CcsA [Firmicutes bacterium]|nr:cytochrome c biogenesis protein CcsA [Bacillota bacterium]
MIGVGGLALTLAMASTLYTAVAGWLTFRRPLTGWQESVRGGMLAVALNYTAAVLCLEYLLLTGDFAVRAVYNHTDRAMPLLYKLSALWGGDSGSVLFWGWILSLYGAYLAWRSWPREPRVTPLVASLVASLEFFFAGLSLCVVNPFATALGHPVNGAGLDPLLQNPVMVIHPPLMYLGLIGMAVPTAWWVAGLWWRRPWSETHARIRGWLLWSWLSLSAALVLGGIWAYLELGWGGYWEWDPVENAALLPWLTATAWLHTLQLDRHRGTHRWLASMLAASSFLLTLVATYITRSGVLKNSVHSFTGTGIGPYFVGLFWASVIYLVVVHWSRRDMLKDRQVSIPGWTQETLIVAMAGLFSTIAGVVLLGTFYPVLSKALSGRTVVLSRGFFNTTTAPLFVAIIGILGWSPLLRWRRWPEPGTLKDAAWMGSVALVGGLVAIHEGYRGLACISWMAAIFTLLSLALNAWRQIRGASVTKNIVVAWRRAMGRSWRRRGQWGAFLAHGAFILVALSVMVSTVRQVSQLDWIHSGQVITVLGYHLRYRGMRTELYRNHVNMVARLSVTRGFQHWTMTPGLAFFPGASAPVAVVAIHEALMRDLYVVMEDVTPGQALIEVMVNPWVMWIWVGSGFVILGGATALLLSPRRRQSDEPMVPPVLRGSGPPSDVMVERGDGP